MTPFPTNLGENAHPADAQLDAALLIVQLRRLIRTWRGRASTAPPTIADVYRQVESDVASCIGSIPQERALWGAARQDLVEAIRQLLREEARNA